MQCRQCVEVMLALYERGASPCGGAGMDLPFGQQYTGLFQSHGVAGWKLFFLLK